MLVWTATVFCPWSSFSSRQHGRLCLAVLTGTVMDVSEFHLHVRMSLSVCPSLKRAGGGTH